MRFKRSNAGRMHHPNLVVAHRVLDRMLSAAQHHIEDETGEAMVGLIVPGGHPDGVPTLYVLDTISPDETALRQYHTFQQGDERQDELIWWLQENWRDTPPCADRRRGKSWMCRCAISATGTNSPAS